MSNILPFFTDILNNPIYYLHKILTDNKSPVDTTTLSATYAGGKNEFIKYEYGPYLLMTNNIPSTLKISDIKNDYELCAMVHMASIIKSINRKDRIFHIKNIIHDAIINIPDEYKYKDILKDKYFDIINSIRGIQKEEKLLESAMINCSPIVPYCGTIRKPGDESTNELLIPRDVNISFLIDTFRTYHTLNDIINNVLNKLLIENITDIIVNYDSCVKIRNNSEKNDFVYSGKTVKIPNFFSLPEFKYDTVSNIMGWDMLTYIPANSNGMAELYYALTYLVYKFDESEYPTVLKYLEDKYNLILNINGNMPINVEAAIECFGALTPISD
jgi:hypothetical protein